MRMDHPDGTFDTASRRSFRGLDRAVNKIIWTGHPPPAEQIRDQVRSSSGATFVRRMTAFTRPLARRVTLKDAVVPTPLRPIAGQARQLLNFLNDLAVDGRSIPQLRSVILSLGEGWSYAAIGGALRTLAAHNLLIYWSGSKTYGRGHLVIRMAQGGAELRTVGAPAEIVL